MTNNNENTSLLSTSTKSMDGPVVKWTIADSFKSNQLMYMNYHAMASGYDFLTPVGTVLGGVVHTIGYRPFPSVLQTMGTAGLITGCAGMVLGAGLLSRIAAKGDDASPPWNEEGRQQRIDGLSHNFKVRVIDLGVWSGIAAATGVLVVAGGPTKLRLSAGLLGVTQALSLGSATGTILGFGCIMYHESKFWKDDD